MNAKLENSSSSNDLDRKNALTKDYYIILSKYERNFGSKVKPTQLKKVWSLLHRKPLPDNFIIRNINYRPYFLLGIFFGFMAIYLGYELYKKPDNNMYIFMFFIGLILIIIFTYKSMTYKRNDEPVIQLSKMGLQIKNSSFYSWSNIQTFQLIEGGKYRLDSLIVKPILEKEFIQKLSFLDYSPNHIIHLIEKYKNLP